VEEKILLFKSMFKKGISIFKILIGIKCIETNKKMIINVNLLVGLILVLRSSKKPTRNIKLHKYIYSIKILE
jgi:hypothetical protein